MNLDTKFVDVNMLTEAVTRGVTDKISIEKLNELIAQTAAYAVTKHPDYGLMGGRLCVLALNEATSDSVIDTFRKLYEHVCRKNGRHAPLIS